MHEQDQDGPGTAQVAPEDVHDCDALRKTIGRKGAAHPHLARRWRGDWRGLADGSRSGRAMALGAALKRAGFPFDEMCAGLGSIRIPPSG